MTNQYLPTYTCENMDIFLFTRSNFKTTSLVCDHLILTGYKILLNDFAVLRSVPERQSLLIYEHLFIKFQRLNLNTQLYLSNFQ